MTRRGTDDRAPKGAASHTGSARTTSVDKEKIIEASVKLFGERGYAATSIRDIAKTLNVSIATLYYYYKNKEELLHTIIVEIGEDLLRTISQARDGAADPLEGLRRMLAAHIRLTEEKSCRVKIYVEEQHNLSKQFSKTIYRQHRKIYDTYMDQLRLLEKLDVLAIDSPQLIAFAMFGMVNWCYRWFRTGGALTIEQVSERLLKMIFSGILKPGVSWPAAGEQKR